MKYLIILFLILMVSCTAEQPVKPAPKPEPEKPKEGTVDHPIKSGSLEIIRHNFNGYKPVDVLINHKHNTVCYWWAGDFGCSTMGTMNSEDITMINTNTKSDRVKELEAKLEELAKIKELETKIENLSTTDGYND